jgi:hypothetical protein
LGDTITNFKDMDVAAEKIEVPMPSEGSIILSSMQYKKKIIELTGILDKPGTVIFPSGTPDGSEWVIINNTSTLITLKADSGTRVNVLSGFENAIYKDKGGLHQYSPRTVNACVIEDNRIRAAWNTKAIPPCWGDIGSSMPPHTVVKVNTNAVGTVIGKWWVFSLREDKKEYKLFDIVETSPFTGKRIPNILFGLTHTKTHLHRDGVDGGHVLLPFASTQVDVSEVNVGVNPIAPHYLRVDANNPHHLIFIPDTSKWSNYRLRISGSVESLSIGNPTIRTSGAPLFFEFVNSLPNRVNVNFDSEYNVGGSLIIPPGKTVSGILLFEQGQRWTSHSPWTCEGLPHYLLSRGVGPSISSAFTIRPTHQIHHVSGDATIHEIIPPAGFSGELILIPDGKWKTVATPTGNIKTKTEATVDRPVLCIYDSMIEKKWYLMA